ncbi:tetratricopeptide repeat protein [Rhodoferax sp.]|uniref:tetratricopeptide repeat protein n=1 Tax=Rhodoferax sp. TaxID=50421 RepID=UPI00283E8D70|nr:tetratricopeptide repeat protein [Rhodoferax sp.]MDR3371192.1 tetratricopeptide repeat protein [Rhodoferax sp.]
MDYYEWMRLKIVLLPVLLSLSLGLHAQGSNPTQAIPKQSALDAPLFYEILLGELNARDREPGAAFSLLLDAAQKTKDPAVFRRAVQVALQARSGESALRAAKAWSHAIPESREASHFVLQILLGLNHISDILEPLKHEIALTPTKERRDFIWSLPQNFERVSDRRAAASTVQKALTNWLNDPGVGATAWATIGRLWMSADDKAKALDAATKGMASDARSEHPALLALSMMSPDAPQAENLVKKHLPFSRPEFRMAYIKSLLNAQREDDAKQQLQIIRTQTPDYADAWLIDGALALQAGQLELADKQLRHYLELVDATPVAQRPAETARGRSQAFFSLSQVAQRRKDLNAAEAWLQSVDNPEDVLRAQVRRASLIAQQGRLEEAIALIRSLPENSDADAALKRAAEVQLLRDEKLYDRARDRLEALTKQYPDDLDLVYELAMLDEKLGNLPDMERLLRSLMAAKPDDPHAYNALGYSLADHNMRLPEAIELISKALELSPKDPFIIDSLAWAQFRSGNISEALRLLKSAFKDQPDPEIAAHLGEVLWTSGQQGEATQIFREGLKLNPDNETLQETIKRLRVTL